MSTTTGRPARANCWRPPTGGAKNWWRGYLPPESLKNAIEAGKALPLGAQPPGGSAVSVAEAVPDGADDGDPDAATPDVESEPSGKKKGAPRAPAAALKGAAEAPASE